MNKFDDVERGLKETIALLQKDHAKMLAPFLKQLVMIQNMKCPKPIFVAFDVAVSNDFSACCVAQKNENGSIEIKEVFEANYKQSITKRTEYKTAISCLIPAIQAAAVAGFPLRVVAAGSMWATFELTDEEVSALSKQMIFLQRD